MSSSSGERGDVKPSYYEMNEVKGGFQDQPTQVEVDADRKGSVEIAEAAEIYGDIQTAEEYGYVHRGLKSRHIQFIALGGTIGTGLFLGIGKHLAQSGPLSLWLGYIITGTAIWAMMQCLGEMCTYLPLPGAIAQYATRYVDPAAGFAIGWNSWYIWGITQAVEISAAAELIGYWNDTITPAAWITLIIVLVLGLNIFAVSIYGEAEFVFASIKIITITGLIIFAFLIDVGAGPGGPIGFRYWHHPGAMAEYIGTGATGRFAGLFATFVGAAFSYGGVETVTVAAGEAAHPRRNIPRAVRRVFWRILFFYVLGSLGVGVLVPYTQPELHKAKGANASPWVIAIQNAGVRGLPSVINAVLVTSASSAANADLYNGSRYLFALAQSGQAPKIFMKCTKSGIPIYAIGLTALFLPLTYMSVATGPGVVFNYLANITTLGNIITWAQVLVSYIQFRKGVAAQGVDRSGWTFRAAGGTVIAWIALGYFTVIMLGNGFSGFTKGNWNTGDFVCNYIGIPIYLACYFGWKFTKGTHWVKPEEMDLHTGLAAVEREAATYVPPVAKNWVEKVWNAIC